MIAEIRCVTSGEFDPLLIEPNNGPQVGISVVPCAGGVGPLRNVVDTESAGNLPPFFFASAVRSAGGVFNAEAAGPFPLASFP